MNIIVIKLGGSILQSQSDFEQAARVVNEELSQGRLPVCIVSAVRGVTDRIIGSINSVRNEKFGISSFMDTLYEDHSKTLPKGVTSEKLHSEGLKLEQVLNYIKHSGELSDSVYAYTVSRGENLAMRILSEHLESLGIKNSCFYGEDIIVTDENVRDAAVDLEKTQIQVDKILTPELDKGIIPIVAGFAGRSKSGLVTILGRGGTDDTAACLGFCLNASKVVKFVDEGGIMSLDPKFARELNKNRAVVEKIGLIPAPTLIPYLSYVEASELLREERTKIVHFKVLEPLMKGGITLELKSIEKNMGGTVIGPENGQNGSKKPKALSYQRDLYGVRILPSQAILPTDVYAQIFRALSDAGVDVRYLSTSGYQVSLLMSENDIDLAMDALSKNKAAMEVKRIDGKKATLSIVGSGMRGVKGLFSKFTGALAQYGVNIEQATQPNSENIIRVSIADEDLPLAAAAVYKAFFSG